MLKLQNLTIKQKLTAIIMIPSAAIMLLAITALVVREQIESRHLLVKNTLTHAEMLADNCKASIAFEHKQDAEQTLSTLRAQDSIVFACIYDKHGLVFTEYQCEGITKKIRPPLPRKDSHAFKNGSLSVFKQVVLDNEIIGTVYLRDDMRHLSSDLKWDIIVAVVILLFGLVMSYFLSSIFQKMISKPILNLTYVAQKVSKKNDYSVRALEESNDEVGYLIQVFNTMLEQIQQRDSALIDAKDQLEIKVRERTADLTTTNKHLTKEIAERVKTEAELKVAQEKLIETAHRAGMAEVAADVLHNVGNVLNSINVSTTVIKEKVSNSEVANLEKVASIINEHIDDLGTFLTKDPQGKHIPVYLTEVSKCLQNEQTDIISRLQALVDNVQYIKDIIGMQQSYAKVSGAEVQTSLSKLVEDAIQINSAGLERHGTQLIRKFEELGDVEIDKQKVLQIMVNLISNAKYALSDSSKEEKLLTIRIYKHSEERFRIEVADNGVGISEDNLTKIFSHGFTTKEHGHGFGLHSSALAAKEMGGSLTVHSDGVGQGATFTLELPFKPVEVMK